MEAIEVMYHTNLNLEDIVTPVNVDALEGLLRSAGYEEQKLRFLTDGFQNGFSIGYEGPEEVRQSSPNLRLEVGNETVLWNKIMKEIKAERFAGPSMSYPLTILSKAQLGWF